MSASLEIALNETALKIIKPERPPFPALPKQPEPDEPARESYLDAKRKLDEIVEHLDEIPFTAPELKKAFIDLQKRQFNTLEKATIEAIERFYVDAKVEQLHWKR